MPIYEYTCSSCGHGFELLVRKETTPACPECQGEEVEKQFSLPKIQGDGSRDRAMRAAKKRDARQGKDRMHDQLKYEESHDRHG